MPTSLHLTSLAAMAAIRFVTYAVGAYLLLQGVIA